MKRKEVDQAILLMTEALKQPMILTPGPGSKTQLTQRECEKGRSLGIAFTDVNGRRKHCI